MVRKFHDEGVGVEYPERVHDRSRYGFTGSIHLM